jgi:hypothetical protein
VVTYFYGTCAECINKIDRDKAAYQDANDYSITIHIRGMKNKLSVNSIKNGSVSITGDFDLNTIQLTC